MIGNGLEDYLDEHMPSIDKYLEGKGVPLSERFTKAAKIFFENTVIESNVDINHDFFASEYFYCHILPLFHGWYCDKYGDLMNVEHADYYLRLITVSGQPFMINIPKAKKKLVKENELIELTMLDRFSDDENLADFIGRRKNIETTILFGSNDSIKQLSNVVTLTRSINLNTQGVVGLNPEVTRMLRGVITSIEQSVRGIASLKAENISTSCWELHFAIERAFKVLIYCSSKRIEHGHNLSKLNCTLEQLGHELEPKLLLNMLTGKEAIAMRYGEKTITFLEAYQRYMNSLALIDEVTFLLPRRYNLRNATFVLKKAAWAR